MTSAISPPRRLLADCSPSTQRTASTTLLLPEPLGPTMAVTPGAKSNAVLSAKLLNPTSSRRLSMRASKNVHHRGTEGTEKTRQRRNMNSSLRIVSSLCPLCLCGESLTYSDPPAAGSVRGLRGLAADGRSYRVGVAPISAEAQRAQRRHN